MGVSHGSIVHIRALSLTLTMFHFNNFHYFTQTSFLCVQERQNDLVSAGGCLDRPLPLGGSLIER